MKDIEIIDTALLVIIILLIIAKKRITPRNRSLRKMVVDSCGLIDGRILELGNTGFIPDEVIIPEFIISELQLLADGSDSHKRERARFGLDVVKELQENKNMSIIIDHTPKVRGSNTDDKLVDLSQKLKASLYTTDFNLNKVADIKGVTVLNVNELAHQLRPTALPGEQMKVKILQKGSNRSQGVGYIDDGTMVVIDNAANLLGKIVTVEIIRSFQTVAGKMLFARLIQGNGP